MDKLDDRYLSSVLCYVDRPWAYFTTQALDKQWGDDWNDAPYEHNAGLPYEDHEKPRSWEVYQIAFHSGHQTPSDLSGSNSRFSVDMINSGASPWLFLNHYEPGEPGRKHQAIQAGTTLADFVRLIREAGGEVYLPAWLIPSLVPPKEGT